MIEYTEEIKYKMKKAAISGEWSQIKPLLQQYGNELASVYFNGGLNLNFTALHYIVCSAPDIKVSAESIKNLVAIESVDIEARNYVGSTPLHWASISGKVNLLRELILCGAIIDTEDNYGHTPILDCCDHAIYFGHEINLKKEKILSLLKNPPRTYKQELIDKRNLLAMILNKLIPLGTKRDINQLLISIGY